MSLLQFLKRDKTSDELLREQRLGNLVLRGLAFAESDLPATFVCWARGRKIRVKSIPGRGVTVDCLKEVPEHGVHQR